MAYDNLPYFEAKNLVIKGEKSSSSPAPVKTLREFPTLPSKGGITLVNKTTSSLFGDDRQRSWASVVKDCGPEVQTRALVLLDQMLAVQDVDLLFDRIARAIELHTLHETKTPLKDATKSAN